MEYNNFTKVVFFLLLVGEFFCSHIPILFLVEIGGGNCRALCWMCELVGILLRFSLSKQAIHLQGNKK